MKTRALLENGALGFPTDGVIRILVDHSHHAEQQALAQEYLLRGPDQTLVPLEVSIEGRFVILRPIAPLAPLTAFTLEQVYVFSMNGPRLAYYQRWSAAHRNVEGVEGPVKFYRSWQAPISFTTGAGRAKPPEPARLDMLSLHLQRHYPLHPIEGGMVVVRYRPPATLQRFDMFALEVRNQGLVYRFPHDERAAIRDLGPTGYVQHLGNNGACAFKEDHIPVAPEYRLVTISASGARAPTEWRAPEPALNVLQKLLLNR